jgi:hypothetical protein
LLLTALLITGCSSKVTHSFDTDVQNRVMTVSDCLPKPLAVIKALIGFANLWRLNDGNDPADPAGLAWSEQANGTINYTITVTGFTLTGVISFYNASGALQNLNLSIVSLSQAIDDAATQLAAQGPNSFMVGTWQVNDTGGPAESGSGAFTGFIGGSTNQNELEEIRTTTATPSGGPPPNATGSITVVDGGETCMLTFDTPHAPATVGVRTDEAPTQQYPIGTIHFALQGPLASVEADLVFDGTVIARLYVTGIGGHFDINLETLTVTAAP